MSLDIDEGRERASQKFEPIVFGAASESPMPLNALVLFGVESYVGGVESVIFGVEGEEMDDSESDSDDELDVSDAGRDETNVRACRPRVEDVGSVPASRRPQTHELGLVEDVASDCTTVVELRERDAARRHENDVAMVDAVNVAPNFVCMRHVSVTELSRQWLLKSWLKSTRYSRLYFPTSSRVRKSMAPVFQYRPDSNLNHRSSF